MKPNFVQSVFTNIAGWKMDPLIEGVGPIENGEKIQPASYVRTTRGWAFWSFFFHYLRVGDGTVVEKLQ